MINPITQMKTAKLQARIVELESLKKSEVVENKKQRKATPQLTAKPAKNGKAGTLSLVNYPQWNYQFELALAAIERCKADYTDCFHHKRQFAKECQDLKNRLNAGVNLLQKITQNRPLASDEQRDFKGFARAVGYLTRQLNTIIQHIEAVDNGTNVKHYRHTNKESSSNAFFKLP